MHTCLLIIRWSIECDLPRFAALHQQHPQCVCCDTCRRFSIALGTAGLRFTDRVRSPGFSQQNHIGVRLLLVQLLPQTHHTFMSTIYHSFPIFLFLLPFSEHRPAIVARWTRPWPTTLCWLASRIVQVHIATITLQAHSMCHAACVQRVTGGHPVM